MATALLHEEFIDDETAALREAFNADFWEQAGWDASLRLVRPPADHPLLGYSCCVIPGANNRHQGREEYVRCAVDVREDITDGGAVHSRCTTGAGGRGVATPPVRRNVLGGGFPPPQQVQSVRLCDARHSLCGDRFGATAADTVDQFLRQQT